MKEIFDQFTKFTDINMGKFSTKPVINFTAITTRSIERLFKNSLDTMNLMFTGTLNYAQEVASSKDIVHLNLQTLKDTTNKGIYHIQKTLETLADTSAEYLKLIEENVCSATSSNVSPEKKTTTTGTGKV